jgi:hypothetical protein
MKLPGDKLRQPILLVSAAVGAVLLVLRYIKEDLRDLRADVKKYAAELKKEVKKDLKAIKADIKNSEERVTSRIAGLETALRELGHNIQHHPPHPITPPISPSSTNKD